MGNTIYVYITLLSLFSMIFVVKIGLGSLLLSKGEKFWGHLLFVSCIATSGFIIATVKAIVKMAAGG